MDWVVHQEKIDHLEGIQGIERFLLLFQRSVLYWIRIYQILNRVFPVVLVVDWRIKGMVVGLCYRPSSQLIMGLWLKFLGVEVLLQGEWARVVVCFLCVEGVIRCDPVRSYS